MQVDEQAAEYTEFVKLVRGKKRKAACITVAAPEPSSSVTDEASDTSSSATSASIHAAATPDNSELLKAITVLQAAGLDSPAAMLQALTIAQAVDAPKKVAVPMTRR